VDNRWTSAPAAGLAIHRASTILLDKTESKRDICKPFISYFEAAMP
jgi:hypothetical protein